MAPRGAHLRRFASFIIRHPRTTMLVVGTITALLAIQALSLQIEVTPDEQLPQSHPYVAAFHDVHRRFGDKDLLVIAISPTYGSVTDRNFLATIREITTRISEIPGCVRPLLQGLGSEATKDVRLTPDGLRVSPLLEDLPNTPADSSLLRSRLMNDPLLHGLLVSKDGTSLAIYATFEPSAELPGYVNISERVQRILDEANQGGLYSYSLSGPVAIVAGLTTYAGRALLLFPVCLIVIGLIHFEAFRTWQAVFLPLLTGLLGVTWAIGFMGLFKIPLDPFNSTTPVLILAIGTGHAVQILKRYYEHLHYAGDSKTAITTALSTTGAATTAAALIAAASFLSLATFSTDSMRRFGTFTALGIVSSLIIELTLIPALRAMLPHTPIAPANHNRGMRVSGWLATLLTSRLGIYLTLLSYGALTALSAVLSLKISTDSSFVRQFGPAHPIRIQDAYINEHFSGANVLLFVVTADDATLATPAAMNGLRSFGERLKKVPTIGHVSLITDTLARMHSVLSPEGREALPQTKELLSQYLFLYSLSGGGELSSVITPDYRSTKIVTLITEDSTAQGAKLITLARAIADETLPPGLTLEIAGTIASNLALTETMVQGKLLNICQVVAITTLVSALMFRSPIGGLLVALPLTLAILVNFGVMGLFAIPLDVGTAAVSAMAVGIGADYAIYFLFRLREEFEHAGEFRTALKRTIESAGAAIIFVASAIGCGYAILCTAGYQLYFNLGLLIALAMATSSIASIVVVPAAIGALLDCGVRLSLLSSPRARYDADPREEEQRRAEG